MKEKKELVKFEAQFKRCLYPQPANLLGKDEDHKYGITKWEVIRNLTDTLSTTTPDTDITLPVDKEGTVTVVGNFDGMPDKKNTYTILASRTSHPKYGEQFEIIYINTIVNLTDIKDVNAFLTSIAHPRQVKELYEKFDDPLKIIADHDIAALTSVKGIGTYLANKLIERYEANKDDSDIYLELADYNLTSTMIDKLKMTYGAPRRIIEVIKTNPYLLSFDVEGVGFKMADKIAMDGGLNPKSSARVAAYIYFLLTDNAVNFGNSYLRANEIITGLFDFFGGKYNIYEEYTDNEGNVTGNNIQEAIDYLVNSEKILIEENSNKAMRRVFLKEIYLLESEIAKHLLRIKDGENKFVYKDWEDKVKAVEKKQGFEFTGEQKAGIKLGLDSQVCLIHGLAGCVDADTEFFTGTGWKKISEYQEGDMVLQWEKDGNASLVKPLKYIKQKNISGFNVISNKSKSICQMLSDNHIMVYESGNGKLIYEQCDNFVKKHNDSKTGHIGRFITNFKYNGPGIKLSDDEIRLMIAVHADGWFDSRRNIDTCRISIKKPRKITRLRNILNKCNIEYKESIGSGSEEGYHKFYFKPPIKSKHYGNDWYNCSSEQKKIILNEIFLWDGSGPDTGNHSCRMYYSSNIEDANFIQFVFASCGFSSSISIDHRADKPIIYQVSRSTRISKRVSLRAKHANQKETIKKVKSTDGFEYCFNVPSGCLVLRCNNRIFITHNCGKSTLLSGILGSLERYSFAGCSLSGKAAARIQEVTGRKSSTIHKLLGYTSAGGFTYTEANQLPYDIVILDEVSMVGGEIFLSLLQAIKTGTKLIMLGDTSQLESIGTLNIAKDIYNSSVIPTVNLTQVHRQGEKSGILSCSREIRACRPLFDSDAEGLKVFGEKKDMIFDLDYEPTDILDTTMQWFKKLYESKAVQKNINNIQLIAPVKERGDACVYNLNNEVQDYILTQKGLDKTTLDSVQLGVGTKTFRIYKGDKVMCIKNNYNIFLDDPSRFSDEPKTTAIFNGWVGIVYEVDALGKEIHIHFPLGEKGEQDVVFDFAQARNCLTLGYASTVHKLQGSDCPVVIGAIDFATPPSMLTCQLLYTLVTRAKETCVVVGQTGALIKATLTDNVCIKKTFLPEFLEGNKITLEERCLK